MFESIGFHYVEKHADEMKDVHFQGRSVDFESKKSLKSAMSSLLKDFTCPSCGGHRVDGRGIYVSFGEIRVYSEKKKKNFFGKEYYDDVHVKTVWRIHEVGLTPGKKGGFFDSGIGPGYLRCRAKGCGWEKVAPIHPKDRYVEWYSFNDIIAGRSFRR